MLSGTLRKHSSNTTIRNFFLSNNAMTHDLMNLFPLTNPLAWHKCQIIAQFGGMNNHQITTCRCLLDPFNPIPTIRITLKLHFNLTVPFNEVTPGSTTHFLDDVALFANCVDACQALVKFEGWPAIDLSIFIMFVGRCLAKHEGFGIRVLDGGVWRNIFAR
jgi:hypothetical protein